jgi:hypothetical protein
VRFPAVDDEADRQVLERTLYGKIALEDLSEDQSRDMIAAAERRMQRRRKLLDEAKRRVESGVLPITGLTAFLEQFDTSRKVYEQTVGRARLFQQLAEMVRAEQEMESRMDEATADNLRPGDRFDGDGSAVSTGQVRAIEVTFEKEFGKPLPVSARGETVLHRTLGFDHRGRLDVAVNPGSREGLWLRRFLEALRVPYLAFYGAVAGQATGAHIHVGPPSNRIRRTD